MPKIASDIDSNQCKRIFDVLREETTLMEGYTTADVEAISQLFRVVSF